MSIRLRRWSHPRRIVVQITFVAKSTWCIVFVKVLHIPKLIRKRDPLSFLKNSGFEPMKDHVNFNFMFEQYEFGDDKTGIFVDS